MCGRYTLTTPLEALRRLFDFPQSPNFAPLYNVAPTMTVPIVRHAEGETELTPMRWGLVPYWAKDVSFGARAINARAETIANKPAFREAYVARRCLVPADGYYEWAGEGTLKRPYRIGLHSWEPFGLAGLWDEWRGPDGPVRSCTIVTTEPNELTRAIHDRMPVVLPKESHARWLDPANTTGEGLADLLAPFDSDAMAVYEVSARVNSVKNDSPDVIAVAFGARQGTLGL